MRRVRTISREVLWPEAMTPQRLYAGRGPQASKIQSELHGDMQSQAEMTWPPSDARE
jgi:hypothetical protein